MFGTTLLINIILIVTSLIVLATKMGYPNHRKIALEIYLLSWIPFILSIRAKQQFIQEKGIIVSNFLDHYGWHLLIFGILLIVGYIVLALFPLRSKIRKIPTDALNKHIDGDIQALLYSKQEIDQLIAVFKEKFLKLSPKKMITQSDTITNTWNELIGNLIAIDTIKNKYRGFTYINMVKSMKLQARAFFLAYASFISEYEISLKLVELIDDNDALTSILNNGKHESDIPPKSYSRLKHRLTQTRSTIQLNAGRLYRKIIARKAKEPELNKLIMNGLKTIDRSRRKFPRLAIDRPLEKLESQSFRAWFPIQKNTAKLFSYIRFARRNYLISPKRIEKYIDQLEPTDIFLERREWHATNVGIPGYWTHAALYLGTLEEMDTYFGENISNQIKERYPKVHKQMSETDKKGYPYRIIEVKRPGVILSSLEVSAGCDAVCVLRPKKLSKDEKKQVIFNALSHFGKGYDYNFNFTTDDNLVCSELVYRSFINTDHLNFKTYKLNGRLIYSPNNIVMKFDHELDTKNEELEFVLFLDGNERKRKVSERAQKELRKSWQRPKWHIVKDYV